MPSTKIQHFLTFYRVVVIKEKWFYCHEFPFVSRFLDFELSWLVKNLFSSWVNTILTVIALIFLYQVGSFFLNWAIFDADFRYNFQGELIIDRGFCSKNIMPGEYGACWAIIFARWNQFMYGLYPIEEAWRVNLIYALLPLAIIGILFDKIPFRKYFIYFTFIYPFLAYFMLYVPILGLLYALWRTRIKCCRYK